MSSLLFRLLSVAVEAEFIANLGKRPYQVTAKATSDRKNGSLVFYWGGDGVYPEGNLEQCFHPNLLHLLCTHLHAFTHPHTHTHSRPPSSPSFLPLSPLPNCCLFYTFLSLGRRGWGKGEREDEIKRRRWLPHLCEGQNNTSNLWRRRKEEDEEEKEGEEEGEEEEKGPVCFSEKETSNLLFIPGAPEFTAAPGKPFHAWSHNWTLPSGLVVQDWPRVLKHKRAGASIGAKCGPRRGKTVLGASGGNATLATFPFVYFLTPPLQHNLRFSSFGKQQIVITRLRLGGTRRTIRFSPSSPAAPMGGKERGVGGG